MICSTVGDIGDSCILLGIISQIPNGPHDLLLQKSNVTKMRSDEDVKRWHSIVQPLFESQPYIRECRVAGECEKADWDSGGFRGSGLHSKTATLFDAQLSHLVKAKGIGRNFSSVHPWLRVTPSRDSYDRIIVSRSGRYRNGEFPWQQIVDFYGDRLLFTGLPHEWAEFSGMFGMVEFRPVKDFLELAQLIAGSLLFIGNQSSPMTVAEGLKHPTIQETSLNPADCIYKRDNAQYCYCGEVTLPGFGKEDLHIQRRARGPESISTSVAPPGRWQFPGFPYPATDMVHAITLAKKLPHFKGKTSEEIKTAIIQHTLERLPDWQQSKDTAYHNVRMALLNAGITAQPTAVSQVSSSRGCGNPPTIAKSFEQMNNPQAVQPESPLHALHKRTGKSLV